jgi:hypothetical protein
VNTNDDSLEGTPNKMNGTECNNSDVVVTCEMIDKHKDSVVFPFSE